MLKIFLKHYRRSNIIVLTLYLHAPRRLSALVKYANIYFNNMGVKANIARGSPLQMFYKVGVPEKFSKFTGNCVEVTFLIKLQA